MVIAATNTGSGFIGGGIGLGIPHPRGPGEPPVVPAVLPQIFPGARVGVVVKVLAALGMTAAIVDGWSRIVADPVRELEEVAEGIREAMEEALRRGRNGTRYGRTTKKPEPRRAVPGGPQTLYIGPDIYKKIGTDVAEMPETKELPDPETGTERKTRRKKKKSAVTWFERRYSVRLGSKNQLMLLPKELDRAQRAQRRANNASKNR